MNTNHIGLGTDFRADTSGQPCVDTGGLRTWARARLEAFRRYQQRRRAIAELVRMSDWRLADLGIPRERIPEVVDGLIAREGPAYKCLAG
jgi:uncharacterized protein YjiS (DUF1127 family)